MSSLNPFAIYLEDPETGELQTLYEPTEKQREFHAATQPNVLYVGARGTGKSHALRWEAHARALAYPGFVYIIMRRTYKQLEETHLKFIDAEMKKLGGIYNVTNKVAKYANGSRGTFLHCESDADVNNILSAEYHWMGFDEMSTFPWEMIVRLMGSVRVKKDSGLTAMVRGSTNPLGESASDLNRYFVLKDIEWEEDDEYCAEDWHAVHTTFGDNQHVDVAQYRKKMAGQPEHVKKAWLEGEFMPERQLFDVRKFKNGKPYHIIPELPTWHDGTELINQPWIRIYRAFDNGYFPDPAVCLWFMIVGRRIFLFKERIYIKKTAKEIAADIKRESEGMQVVDTFCDPTMHIRTTADVKTIRDIFEEEGVPMTPSINNREFYAQSINAALKEEIDGYPRLVIYANGQRGAPYTAKYLPQMKYDEKNPMAMADHKHDHYAVAMAYFLMSYIPTTAPVVSTTLPYWMRRNKQDRPRLGRNNVRGR